MSNINNNLLEHELFKHRLFFPAYVSEDGKFHPSVKWQEPGVAVPGNQALAQWRNATHWGMKTGDGLIVIDVDGKNGGTLEKAFELGCHDNTFMVKSKSPDSYHLIYSTRDAIPNSIQKIAPGIDILYETRLLWVAPTPGYEIIHDLPVAPLPEKVAARLRQPGPPPAAPRAPRDGLIPKGQRNDRLFREGCALKSRGLSNTTIEAALERLNEENCETPLQPSELKTLIRSVLERDGGELFTYSKPTEKASRNRRAEAPTGAEIIAAEGPFTTEYVWRKRFARKLSTVVFAPGGVGKTTLLLEAIKEILEADPNATAMWLAVEGNYQDTFDKMIEQGVDTTRLRFPRMGQSDYAFDFSKSDDIAELDSLMDEHKPVIVVVDSLSAMAGKTDINTAAIRPVMQQMESTICGKHKAALIYIHHTNKSNGIYGSAFIRNQVRAAFVLEETNDGKRILSQDKWNLSKADKPSPLIFADIDGKYCIVETDDMKTSSAIKAILTELFAHTKRIPAYRCHAAINNNGITASKTYRYDICNELGIKRVVEDGQWYWVVDELFNKDGE